jgi:Ulp1 family protease
MYYFSLKYKQYNWAVIVADLELSKFFYLDSLRGQNGLFWMQCIWQYFIDMHIQQHGVETVPEWTMECIYNCAQQPNGYDCGVYTCLFAYCLMMGLSIPIVFFRSILQVDFQWHNLSGMDVCCRC